MFTALSPAFPTLGEWAAIGVLATILASISWVDARERIIPDAASISLILLGIGYHTLADLPVGGAVIAGLIGYWSFFALERGYAALRGREGLGRGDAKLFAAAGTWVGPWFLAHVAMVGAFAGLAYVLVHSRLTGQTADGGVEIPFGPFLALGLLVVFTARLVLT